VLRLVKEAVPDTPVFANTGVRLENVEEQLAVADGAVVGTTFKKEGLFENHVDEKRVSAFMKRVRELR
jgi:predicted TIM-barrel enzyme